MQEDEETKEPAEITSDELPDFVIAPEVVTKLKERVRKYPQNGADSEAG